MPWLGPKHAPAATSLMHDNNRSIAGAFETSTSAYSFPI